MRFCQQNSEHFAVVVVPMGEHLRRRRKLTARRGGRRFETRGEAGEKAFDDVAKALLLAVEVEVESALRYAGVRDLHFGRSETSLRKRRFGGAEKVDLGVGVAGRAMAKRKTTGC